MDNELLEKISDYKIEGGVAHNIRKNGESISRAETDNIKIKTKKDKPGIDIFIKEGTQEEYVHIPVIITTTNYEETVYNDFYVGKNANVTIVAGCGIHNDCETGSVHNGIHTFHIEPGANVKYIEKHYADGLYDNNKFINTDTIIELDKNSSMTMETAQISGIDKAIRKTFATLNNDSTLKIKETLMSNNKEEIETNFDIKMEGKNTNADIASKSVARKDSKQTFRSNVDGNNKCFAHVSCDAIVMENSKVTSIPAINANSKEAEISHEAVIGKIATDQITKLMSLGLTESEAEEKILEGFLK